MSAVSKLFGSNYALKDVGFDVMPGQVHGLLGENGSGKSTLVKVLAGLYQPETGARISINGSPLGADLSMSQRRNRGLGFVQQTLGVIPELTVAENLALSRLSTERDLAIDWRSSRASAQEALAKFGLDLDTKAVVGSLPPVQRATLAIVRALEDLRSSDAERAGQSMLLVLDEPTVFLERRSLDRLARVLRTLTGQNHGVLLVTHRLDEVLGLTDEVTVLRDGRSVASASTPTLTKQSLVTLIVGHAAHPNGRVDVAGPERQRGSATQKHEAASARIRVADGGRVRQMELSLAPGRIVGVTGLGGTGWEDLPYCVSGAIAASGEIRVGSSSWPITGLTPRESLEHGVALVPANRLQQGCIAELNLADNLTMVRTRGYIRKGFLRRAEVYRDAKEMLDRYDVRPPDPDALLGTLSGGNQQKVLLAKWIEERPEILALHEPTQGVDIGARTQIWAFIRDVAAAGSRILVASSDHEELAELCDEVLIVADGRITARVADAELSQHRIGEMCLASVAEPSSDVGPDQHNGSHREVEMQWP